MNRLVEIRVLGPVDAAIRGRPVGLGRPRALQVLAALVLHEGRVVPLERLIAMVWQDDPPASARTQVSIQISALRRAFDLGDGTPPVIMTTPGGYRLDHTRVWTDVAEAGRLMAAAKAETDPAAAVEQLRSALGLWHGPVLAGLEAPGLAAAAQQWSEARLWTCEQLYAHELTLARGRELVGELTRLVAEHPLREKLRAQLVTALWQSGRRADALASYQEGRRVLLDELGLEPGRELREVERTVLTADPPRANAGVPDPAHVVPAELPGELPVFTGREQQLNRLVELLSSDPPYPVVAVAGPGGVGKSTLAIQVAHSLVGGFPDGQIYIDLRGSTPGSRPLAPKAAQARILRSLGTSDRAVPSDPDEASARLRSLTNSRRLLFVLDNAHDPAQVASLIAAGPGCRVLVTSRRVLVDLPGAVHENLDVLTHAEALQLLKRLTTTAPYDEGAADEIVRLCGHLPLAISLVAARLVTRPGSTLPDLADRLRQEDDRLDALSSGDRALRAGFELGYAELGPRHRRLFRALGLLDGADLGVPVAAALVGLPPETTGRLLEDLTDAQLIRSPRPGRYAMHDLLRLYARERAHAEDPEADRVAALRRAFHCHLATARRAIEIALPLATWRNDLEPQLLTRDGATLDDRDAVYAWLDVERDNLLALVQQAAELPTDEGPVLTAALCAVYAVLLTNRGRVGDAWTMGVVALDAADHTADPRHLAAAHEAIGYGQMQIGDLNAAPEHLRQAREAYRLIGNHSTEAAQVHMLAVVQHRLERYDEAIGSYSEAIDLARSAGRDFVVPLYLTGLGLTYRHLGRTDDEVRTHTAALDAAEASGESRRMTSILANLAEALRRSGRFVEAIAHFRRALELRKATTDTYLDAEIWWGLGKTYQDRGEAVEARAAWSTSAGILAGLGLIDADERHAIESTDRPRTPDVISRNL
ncbi:BTAD domain-containing putative transcriptional regulator [Kribbella sp. NPDC054772]